MGKTESYPSNYFTRPRAEVAKKIIVMPSNLLEIGPGAGEFVAQLNLANSYKVGVEPDESAAKKARLVFDKLIGLGYWEASENLPRCFFDLVICNDVIEHFPDSDAFVEDLHSRICDNGVIVGSIPNVRYLPVMYRLLVAKDWRYESSGVLDRTHLRFFTKKSIERLFLSAGFIVESITGSNPITDNKVFLEKTNPVFRRLLALFLHSIGQYDMVFQQFTFRVKKVDNS